MTLVEFDAEKEWWNNREVTDRAWKVSFEEIEKRKFNLDIKNPNGIESMSYNVEELLEKRNEIKSDINHIKSQILSELKETLV